MGPHRGPRSNAARLLAGAAGWIAVAVIFALLWRRTPLPELRAAVARADSVLLVVATAVGLFSEIVVSSAKSRRILALLGAHLSLWETIVLRMGSYPMRQLMPFKSGELMRMAYLRRCHGLSLARAGLLPIVDAATNAAVVVGLGGAGFALYNGARGLATGVGLLALGGVGAWLAARAWRPAVNAWLKRRFGGAGGWEERIAAHGAAIIGWTIALITLEIANYTLVLRAFHVDLPLSAAAYLVPAVVFVAGLPATPMGLGVREAAISSLFVPYGSAAELLAAAVTCSAVVRLGPTLAALAFVRPFVQRMLVQRGPSKIEPPRRGERHG